MIHLTRLSLILFACAIVSCFEINAQTGGVGGNSINPNQGTTNNAMRVFEFRKLSKHSQDYFVDYETALEQYNKLEGSPYFKEKVILANLHLSTGGYTPNVHIKYDIYNNEIIAWQNEKEKIILDLAAYSKIEGIGADSSLVLKRNPYLNGDKFYEVLFEKEDFVFIKENIKVISNYSSSMPGEQHKRSFTNKVKYYIQRGNAIYEFKLNSKQLQNVPDFRGVNIGKELRKVGMKKLKKEAHFIEFFEKTYDRLINDNSNKTKRVELNKKNKLQWAKNSKTNAWKRFSELAENSRSIYC